MLLGNRRPMPADSTSPDAQALFDKGHQRLQEGDFREAVECFTRAIQLKPQVAAAYRYRALAYIEMGQRLDALNDLDHAIRLRNDDPMLYADRARLLFRQRQFPGAIADCDKALNLDSGLAPLYGLRGECHAANGESQKAFADYALALENDPDHAAEYLLARAELQMELEEYDAALADADVAIARDSEKPGAFQVRGMIYQAMHAEADAEADFDRAIQLDPNRVLAYLARATVRLNSKNYAAARADCDFVIATMPGMAKVYEIRGLCRKYLGDRAGAFADYNEAIKLNPASPLGFNLRAGLHYQDLAFNKAIQDHLDALKRDPKSAGTFNQLAWIWATAPDPDIRNGVRAKECATRACELSEWQEPSFLDTLAAACAELGEFDDAVKWMEKAMKLVKPEELEDYQDRKDLYESEKPLRVKPE